MKSNLSSTPQATHTTTRDRGPHGILPDGAKSSSRRLPLYAEDASVPRFEAIRDREDSLAGAVEALDLAVLRRSRLLSANAKTAVSLDFPVGQTCQPTAICGSVCYASAPSAPAGWKKSLALRLRNLRYFQLEKTDRAVERLTKEFSRAARLWKGPQLNYLRVNGTGDLFPEIVAVINLFAERNPDVKVWVVSRRFDLAAQIADLPNIFLQLSLDASTPPMLEAAARQLVAVHPRAYLSFLRVSPADDTRGAAIVFNEKHARDLPFDRTTDCPVDAGMKPLENQRGVGGSACMKCRKCFGEPVIRRQRGTAGMRRNTQDGGTR